MNLKLILRIGINTLIGAILIFFWFKLVDVKAVFETLKQVNPLLLFLPLICFPVSSLLRAFRLKILLASYKLQTANLWFLTMLGQLLSFTIPIRAGEITKAVYLSTNYEIPFGKSVIWIFLDRFLDFWFSLVIALVLILFVPTNLPSNFKPVLLTSVLTITFATFLVLFFPKLVKKILNFISCLLILDSLKKYFNKFSTFLLESFIFFKKGPKESFLIISSTLGAIFFETMSWLLIFKAFPKGQSLDYFTAQLGSVLSSLTYLIPSAPGYVGSAEAAGLVVFNYSLGMDKTLVSAATVLYHAITLIFIISAGLASLYLLKFNLNLVWKKFRKE